MLQGKTMHVEGENCNFATLSLTRGRAFHCRDLQLHLIHFSVHHLSPWAKCPKKYSLPLKHDRYHILAWIEWIFKLESHPLPHLWIGMFQWCFRAFIPSPPVLPPLPPLPPPYREGRHPPACRSPQCHLLCPPSLQSCNVTYFSAHLPTPALMHLAKVRAGQQGKKKSIFRNWEKKVFDCSKAVPAVPTYRRHSI